MHRSAVKLPIGLDTDLQTGRLWQRTWYFCPTRSVTSAPSQAGQDTEAAAQVEVGLAAAVVDEAVVVVRVLSQSIGEGITVGIHEDIGVADAVAVARGMKAV